MAKKKLIDREQAFLAAIRDPSGYAEWREAQERLESARERLQDVLADADEILLESARSDAQTLTKSRAIALAAARIGVDPAYVRRAAHQERLNMSLWRYGISWPPRCDLTL